MHDIRQVPRFKMNTSSTLLLIGSGRLATHLKHWFNLLSPENTKLTSWSKSMAQTELSQLTKSATHIWLAISDDQINSFYEHQLKKYLHNPQQIVVHFSGSVFHEEIFCAHPLMTFSTENYSLQAYNKIQFALFDQKINLSDLMPGFTNPCFQILPEHKELYHALCVATGNLPQLIWSQTFSIAKNINIPVSALHAYIETITHNFSTLGSKAVTGPLVREDLKTISANLESLEKKSLSLHSIYKSFIPSHLKNLLKKDLL